MQFEIKKLKTNLALSDETLCFSCEVWVDGVHAFNASNHGHGGCNDEYPINKEKFQQAKEFVGKQEWGYHLGEEYVKTKHDLESWVMCLIDDIQIKKQIKSTLSKNLVLLDSTDEKVYTVNLKWHHLSEEHKQIARAKYKEKYFILNELTVEEVWSKYKHLFVQGA